MNDKIKSITDERGANYGHPLNHFTCTQKMYESWCEARNLNVPLDGKEYALRHSVYMILDKLARMAKNPEHMDNWDDIQGYARCGIMVVSEKI